MDDSAPAMAYARVQSDKTYSFEEFVKHISDHNGVFSAGTVQGVVTDTVACLLEILLNGCKVQFGRLGTFGVQISVTPAGSLEDFTAANIKAVNVQFAPGKDFANMRDAAEFNLVNTRAIQKATMAAVKNGADVVDLTPYRPAAPSEEEGGSV